MILTIALKELKALFSGTLAWIILAILTFILAWLFALQLENFLSLQSQLAQFPNAPGFSLMIGAPLFSAIAIFSLMLIPFFGMRLISEERRNQTLQLLISAPISITEIVIGKFMGLVFFLFCIVSLPTFMTLSLYMGGTLDLGVLFTNMIGLILLTASFAALTLFVSSLTTQPILAAIGSLGALLALWVMGAINRSGSDNIFQTLSPLKHFENLNRGLIDTADLLYFIIFITLFLGLTIRQLDSMRLRG